MKQSQEIKEKWSGSIRASTGEGINKDFSENIILLTEQMKSGGTLFRTLLDGNPELLIYPEDPGFFILDEREYESKKHLAYDYLLGIDNEVYNPLHYSDQILDHNRQNQKEPIPVDYVEFPFSAIELKGRLRGKEGVEGSLSYTAYCTSLKAAIGSFECSKRDIIRATGRAMYDSLPKEKRGKVKCWLYRQNITSNHSVFTKKESAAYRFSNFLNHFPAGKIVYVTRDPRGIILSRHDHNLERYKTSWKGVMGFAAFLTDCLSVNYSFQELKNISGNIDSSNLYIVKYEDVVTDSKRTLSDVCNYLGVNFDPIMLSPSSFGKATKVYTAFNYDGSKITPERAYRWKGKLSRLQIIMMDSILTSRSGFAGNQFGYRPETILLLRITFKIIIEFPSRFFFRLVGIFFQKILNRDKFKYPKNKKLDLSNPKYSDWISNPINVFYLKKKFSVYIQKLNIAGFKNLLVLNDPQKIWTTIMSDYGEKVLTANLPDHNISVNEYQQVFTYGLNSSSLDFISNLLSKKYPKTEIWFTCFGRGYLWQIFRQNLSSLNLKKAWQIAKCFGAVTFRGVSFFSGLLIFKSGEHIKTYFDANVEITVSPPVLLGDYQEYGLGMATEYFVKVK